MSFAENFQRGLMLGRQQRRQQDEDVRDEEERKLRIDTLKFQQKQAELEGRYKAFERQRSAAEGQAQSLEGRDLSDLLKTAFVQPGQEVPTNAVTAMNQAGLPALATQERQQVQVPGSEEFGIPGFSVRPRSMQELLQAQARAKFAEPYTLNPGDRRMVGYEMVAEGAPQRPVAQRREPQKTMDQQLLDAIQSGDPALEANIRRVMNARDNKPDATLQAVRELQLANLKNLQSQGGLPPALFNQAKALADDYARDSKDFMAQRNALQAIHATGDNAAGDLSLIFSFMKMLDPASVVREQEYANAQNAAGVPDRVRNLYNSIMDGRRLAPEQRKQFIAQAEGVYRSAKIGNDNIRAAYNQRAQAQGIDPKYVTFDLPDPAPLLSTGGTTQAAPPQQPTEFNWVDGKLVPVQ